MALSGSNKTIPEIRWSWVFILFFTFASTNKAPLWSIKQTGHMTMLTTSPIITIIFHRLQFALNWLWKVYCSQVSNHSPWQPRSLSCSFSNSKSLLNSASDFFPGRFSILMWRTPFSTWPNSNSTFPYLFQKLEDLNVQSNIQMSSIYLNSISRHECELFWWC